MKRIFICAAALVLALALLPAGGTAEGEEALYGGILDMYTAGLGGDDNVIMKDDFNFEAWENSTYAEGDPLATVGYILLDLDADGDRELIIADATEQQLSDGIVFDIWTLENGAPVLLARGWGRNRLYLTDPDPEGCYGFYREGSDSAFMSIWEQGLFRDGEAVTVHTLVYDEEAEILWMLDDAGLDEDTAYNMIDGWRSGVIGLSLIPLSERP